MTELWIGPPEQPDAICLGPAVNAGAEGVLYRSAVRQGAHTVDLAVKMLQPGHLEGLGLWAERWQRQVELLKRAAVPGLVRVRDWFIGPLPHRRGQADPSTASLYLVMDWVEGVSLDHWMASADAVEPEQLLLTLVPVAAALDLLHSGAATSGVSVVHRDVKPANIVVRPGGDTVLVDLGALRGLDCDIRRSGVVGTPGYIAPEVRADGRYGPASDRYALGGVAYFLLTRHDPPADATWEMLRESLEHAPATEGRPELVNHVLAMLDPDPDRRPSLLGNWVAQLRRSSLFPVPGEARLQPLAPRRQPSEGEAVGPSKPPRRHRRPLWGALVVLTLVVPAASLALARPAGVRAPSGPAVGVVAAAGPSAHHTTTTIEPSAMETPVVSVVSTTVTAPRASAASTAPEPVQRVPLASNPGEGWILQRLTSTTRRCLELVVGRERFGPYLCDAKPAVREIGALATAETGVGRLLVAVVDPSIQTFDVSPQFRSASGTVVMDPDVTGVGYLITRLSDGYQFVGRQQVVARTATDAVARLDLPARAGEIEPGELDVRTSLPYGRWPGYRVAGLTGLTYGGTQELGFYDGPAGATCVLYRRFLGTYEGVLVDHCLPPGGGGGPWVFLPPIKPLSDASVGVNLLVVSTTPATRFECLLPGGSPCRPGDAGARVDRSGAVAMTFFPDQLELPRAAGITITVFDGEREVGRTVASVPG